MIQGSTQQHIFSLPFSNRPIEDVRIVYKQGTKKIVKTGDEVTIIDRTAVVRLSQEETLLFDIGKIIEVQISIDTKQGKTLKSKIYRLHPERNLEKEVIK